MSENLKGYSGLLIGTGIAGLCLILLGVQIEEPVWSSIGGSLFGASLGSFIGRLTKKDLSEEIKTTVKETLRAGFISNEDQISAFRIEWHLYHVTKMAGKFVWRHSVLDFRKVPVPGRLLGETVLTDKAGAQTSYVVEGGLRDERLVIFLKARDSEEPSGVYVFPFCGFRFEDKHFGILFHQTWDATHSISPALISRTIIPGGEANGTLPDANYATLDKLWVDGAAALCDVLPRTSSLTPK